ncbi:uncharacterized protein K02A2.6-like [Cydia splendana]|uniref:uncharacterized protein K02A2.6-like n=1 Tax=Cydia splendana TaxID=1100963 RepID=UPI00300C8874
MTQQPSLTLEGLDLDGDRSSIGSKWERWKRSLFIYIDAADVTSDVKKRATLLHFGGTSLQDIYYNLPGAEVKAAVGVDVFDTAIKKLDEYFVPKTNRVFERHMFRLIKQEDKEKFESFLVRLRKQAEKCSFDKKDDHLIDQITEKCNSAELRKKILTIGDSITLEKIVTEANTLEVVNDQLEIYDKKQGSSEKKEENQEVNAIYNRNKKDGAYRTKKEETHRRNNTIPCGRCGKKNHQTDYKECPALDKTCFGCGKMGHFRQYCRTSGMKRKLDNHSSRNIKGNKKARVEVDYVFNIDNDAIIECVLGGIKTDLLVDSGCRPNLITGETWETLKSLGAIATNQTSNPTRSLMPYGSHTPLNVKGSFETTIKANGREEYATVYVIAGGTQDLLGRETATRLGVLKICVDVNKIDEDVKSKPFPKLKDVLVEIPIDQNVQPVSQPYRRIPLPLEQKVENKIQDLLARDIIEEVNGPSRWVSPMVPIIKENGDLRLCVDMRRANTAILRENHPLPCMDKLLPEIGKAKYFSKLDIKDAFHQLELHPDCRHITTFITAKGLYQYKRLMFGISCAPEIFQKVLEKLLVKCDGVLNFIDDILVFGDNEEQHDMRLAMVLEVLKENDILLNEQKCIYKVRKVHFLGHELSPSGVKPLPKYMESISNFRLPATIEELQSFLGLVNYVNKWLPNLATRTEPLKELLRKKLGKKADIKPYWTSEQDRAFTELKEALSKIQSLGYYDINDKTQVIADASPVGLGAILIQTDSNGPRIIAYGNRTLTDCERKYSQTEKEALALVWSVEHFNIFLFGKKFDLITDHKPLEILFGLKSKPCARIERWVLRLQSYDYNVTYRPGKVNIADPLSRLCKLIDAQSKGGDEHIHQIVEQARPHATSMSAIIEASVNDEEVRGVKKGVYEKEWNETVKGYKIFENELCFYGDILLRGNRIVIPQKLRKGVLDAAHEGHPGIVAMKGRLRSKVWWPRIDKDAENLVKSCKSCTLVGLPNPPTPLKRRELPLAPWVDVAMDLLGPLPNNDYLLVVVDYYSRYKEVKISKIVTSCQIIKLLKEIFSRLGYPVSITVDNGRQFVSEEFRSFCEECNIIVHNTVPYWPQMNGEVERQNRDIMKRLKISHLEKKDIKESLMEYLLMYNSTPHSSTDKSPSELFFRRQNRDKIPSIDRFESTTVDLGVRERDKIQKEKGKEYADKRRGATESSLAEGDKVYVKNMDKGHKLSSNYNPTPYTVQSATRGDISVKNDITGQVLRRNVVHLKRVEGQWEAVQRKDQEEGTGGEQGDSNNEL